MRRWGVEIGTPWWLDEGDRKMRIVVVAKDRAYRRGHLPMRDDERQGQRVALICAHCGSRAVKEPGVTDLVGLLVTGRCFPKPGDVVSPTGLSPIEEANWATSAAPGYAERYRQLTGLAT